MDTKSELQNQLVRSHLLKLSAIDGEIDDRLEFEIKANDLGLRNTVDDLADSLSFIDDEIEKVVKVRARLQARSNFLTETKERLKDSIRRTMDLAGFQKIQGHYRGFSLGAENISIEWESTDIPIQFLKTKIVTELDKATLKEFLKTANQEEIDDLKKKGLIMLTKKTLRQSGIPELKVIE